MDTKILSRVVLGFSFVCCAGAFSLSAQAGEVLWMKQGQVMLDSQSSAAFDAVVGNAASDESRDAVPTYWVIQAQDRLNLELQKALEANGLQVLRYLPDDAWVVRATAVQVQQLSALPEVFAQIRAVSPYEMEWKVSPDVFEIRVTNSSRRREQFVVTAFDEIAAADVASRLRTLGVLKGAVGARDFAIQIPRNAVAFMVQQVAAINGVEWIEEVPVMVPFLMNLSEVGPQSEVATNPEMTGYESGTKIMGFDRAWERGFNGVGQTASYADTGLDSGVIATLHPDFANSVKQGFAVGLGADSWGDVQGHGTHVGGSIAGGGQKTDGALKGGAHGARLIPEGLWSGIFNNLAPSTNIEDTIGRSQQAGSRVDSNSWGNPNAKGKYDNFAAKYDEYMWRHPEVLVLFAAGNDGVDADLDGRIDEGSVSSPATAKNVLTVGASENVLLQGGIQKKLKELKGGRPWSVEPLASDTLSNNEDGMAAFSSRGPCKDGRTKPEIVAPGTNIVSTRTKNPKADAKSSLLWGAFGEDYAYAGGTSMATPLTAGAATVARQFIVQKKGIAQPSAAMVKALLMHTAHDMYPGQYGVGSGQEFPTTRPNQHEGYGRVDMAALTQLGNETTLVDDVSGVLLNEAKEIAQVRVQEHSNVRATLSYTDAPGAAGAAKALVNDVDLIVVGSDGVQNTLGDHINNSEMLELKGLKAGVYRILVKGVNVPQGKSGRQPFAVAVSVY